MSVLAGLFWGLIVFFGMVFIPEGYGWPTVAACVTFILTGAFYEYEQEKKKRKNNGS
jgi:hypothetical protein